MSPRIRVPPAAWQRPPALLTRHAAHESPARPQRARPQPVVSLRRAPPAANAAIPAIPVRKLGLSEAAMQLVSRPPLPLPLPPRLPASLPLPAPPQLRPRPRAAMTMEPAAEQKPQPTIELKKRLRAAPAHSTPWTWKRLTAANPTNRTRPGYRRESFGKSSCRCRRPRCFLSGRARATRIRGDSFCWHYRTTDARYRPRPFVLEALSSPMESLSRNTVV